MSRLVYIRGTGTWSVSGRREIADVPPDEIHDELIYQLGALREFARYYDMEVQHVKPHGALYMVAARDEELSRAIIEAIQRVDPGLLLFCMQASVTYDLARRMDQPVVTEFYADREYNDDGQIVFTRTVTEESRPRGGRRKGRPGRDRGQGHDRSGTEHRHPLRLGLRPRRHPRCRRGSPRP